MDESSACTGTALLNTAVPPETTPYVVPADGVIASWQSKTGKFEGTATLKVLRPTGNEGEYFFVAEDGPRDVPKFTAPIFTGVHIPVRAGDFIGLTGKGTNCLSGVLSPAYRYRYFGAEVDPTAGQTRSVLLGEGIGQALQVMATVEPDADRDGFGDETQDGCPSDPLRSAACADTRPPVIKASAKAAQKALKAKALLAVASADESVTLKATATVSLATGSISLAPISVAAAANVETTLRLPIGKGARRKIQTALAGGQKVRATVKVSATDASSNAAEASLSVRIAKAAAKKHRHH